MADGHQDNERSLGQLYEDRENQSIWPGEERIWGMGREMDGLVPFGSLVANPGPWGEGCKGSGLGGI